MRALYRHTMLYPHFNLEDKVLFNGGSNDTNKRKELHMTGKISYRAGEMEGEVVEPCE